MKRNDMPEEALFTLVEEMYRKSGSILSVTEESGLSETKVRKILITLGLWSSKRSERIRQLYESGMSVDEIAVILNIHKVNVSNYLPYEKGVYSLSDRSRNAERIAEYRKRNHDYAKIKKHRERREGMSKKRSENVFAMKLHMELLCDDVDEEEAEVLKKYGGVMEAISRDVVVPSDLSLDQLHYLINVAFGWKDYHLHCFKLHRNQLEELAEGTIMENRNLWGTYLKMEASRMPDLNWDNDYVESMSPKTWMKKKYQHSYRYGGISNYYLENQAELLNFREMCPVLHYHSFRTEERRDIPFDELTLNELVECVAFDGESVDVLNESRRLSEILSKDPIPLYYARKHIRELHAPYEKLYVPFRNNKLSKLKINEYYNFEYMLRDSCGGINVKVMMEESEPKDLDPITDELIYSYDYGDGWKVKITLIEEYGKDGKSVNDAIAEEVICKCKPICVHSDGLSLMDDVGGVGGYVDFLKTIHEGEDEEEREGLKAWARSMGWTGRREMTSKMV